MYCNEKYFSRCIGKLFNNLFLIDIIYKMPIEIIRAFGILKKAAAIVSHDFGILPFEKKEIMLRVCDEIIYGCNPVNTGAGIYRFIEGKKIKQP